MRRLDQAGRDVTDLPGLWSENDRRLPDIESLRKIINTAKLQLAAGDHFDADLTLELALRELQ